MDTVRLAVPRRAACWRMAWRSSEVVPPQIPSCLVSTANARHDARTEHAWQTALAAATRCAAPSDIGKKSSGSSCRQAPRDIHPADAKALSIGTSSSPDNGGVECAERKDSGARPCLPNPRDLHQAPE
jgi:hypothetical protein